MSRQNLFLIIILVVMALVNLAGAFGPELGFDALWYHLTIAKLYLLSGTIYHIPGGLLYYSEMPRLTETLYVPLIKYFSEFGPHLVSWAAGIGSTIIVYKLASKLGLSTFFSLLSSLLFYVTPLVGWESGSAYIDITRTFFEILALYLVLDRKIILGGLVTGLAISTKSLAFWSIIPLSLIILWQDKSLKACILYLVSCILVAAPWFIGAYLFTGYPLYPIGANILPANHTILYEILHPWAIFPDFWQISLFPEDPISPIYLLILPFLILSLPKLSIKTRPLLLYALLGLFAWFYTPHLGGGRYLLPYVPAFAVMAGLVIAGQRTKLIQTTLLLAVLTSVFINAFYRLGANFRLLTYLLGRETKTQYLCRNLDFSTNVFVDCDGWFAKNIKSSDRVYVAGVHNLFYINFPFVDETWYRGEDFDYLLTQNEDINRLKTNESGIIAEKLAARKWVQVYQNKLTGVKVYEQRISSHPVWITFKE